MNEGDDEDTFYSYLALHVCFFLVYCKWCNRCIWFFWCNSSFALLLKAMCLFMTVVILCANLYVCVNVCFSKGMLSAAAAAAATTTTPTHKTEPII